MTKACPKGRNKPGIEDEETYNQWKEEVAAYQKWMEESRQIMHWISLCVSNDFFILDLKKLSFPVEAWYMLARLNSLNSNAQKVHLNKGYPMFGEEKGRSKIMLKKLNSWKKTYHVAISMC